MRGLPLLSLFSVAAFLAGCASTQSRPEPVLRHDQTIAATSRESRDLDARPAVVTGYDQAETLAAAELLAPALLSGPRHRVQPEVALAGSLGLYRIETEYGVQEALGIEMLLTRIGELDVVAELDRMSRLGTFAGAARDNVAETMRALGNVFGRPEETMRALPDAVGRKAGDLWDRTRVGARNVADSVRTYFSGSAEQVTHNVFLPPLLEPVKLETEEERAAARDARARELGSNVALDYIGYSGARRALTAKLGVNPYTTNPLVQERLDSLSWAAWSGSKSTGIAVGVLTGGASVVLSRTRTLNRLVWELDPIELARRNRELLAELGYRNRTSRAFLRNGAFDPALQTAFVDAFALLRAVPGHAALLRWAAQADDAVEARFIVATLDLALARGEGTDLAAVELYRRTAAFQLREGGRLVVLPVDWLQWTPDLEAYLSGLGDVRELRVSGLASRQAAGELAARGITLITEAFPSAAGAFAAD